MGTMGALGTDGGDMMGRMGQPGWDADDSNIIIFFFQRSSRVREWLGAVQAS
jgi:hypothetical protein